MMKIWYVCRHYAQWLCYFWVHLYSIHFCGRCWRLTWGGVGSGTLYYSFIQKKKNFEPKVYLIGVPELSAYSTCSNFPFLRPHCSRWDGKFLFEPHWHPLPLQGGFSCRSVFCTLSTVKNNTIGVCAVNEMQKLPTPEARLAVQHLLACWPYRKAEQ